MSVKMFGNQVLTKRVHPSSVLFEGRCFNFNFQKFAISNEKLMVMDSCIDYSEITDLPNSKVAESVVKAYLKVNLNFSECSV